MRINLLRAHGSPTGYRYKRGCRCVSCATAKAQYDHAYYETHKEKILESARQYRIDNAARVSETKRRYYQAHRDEILEAVRIRYEIDPRPEKRREICSRYRARHREEIAAYNARYNAAYNAKYPERQLARNRNRIARQRDAEGSHTAADVLAQKGRQKSRCYWCNFRLDKYHVDHVVPLALGGGNGPENIVVSCPACNQRKHATHPMDWAGVMF